MVKFGCNKTENFARNVLLQTSCEIAKMKLLHYPGDHRFQSMSKCRDDIWIAAKVVLWGNTRHLAILDTKKLKEPLTDNEKILKESITISKPASEIAEILAEKLGCIQILQDFWNHFEPQETLPALPPPPPSYTHIGQVPAYAYQPYINPYPTYNSPPPHIEKPPAFQSQDPTTEYMPHSPYMPSSPIESKTPDYAPQSPVENQDYVATSPI
jgi:hypothetical protein